MSSKQTNMNECTEVDWIVARCDPDIVGQPQIPEYFFLPIFRWNNQGIYDICDFRLTSRV